MATTPKSSLATLRPDLGYAMMAFDLQANMNAFVALKIAPVLEVGEQMGNWGKIPIEELLRTADDSRAPGARYNQISGKFSPATYACTEHGIEEPVDDRESSIYSGYFDSELVAAMRARHVLLQNYEQRIITQAQVNVATAAAAQNWSTANVSVPCTDMVGWKDQFFTQIGVWPSSFVISRRKFEKTRESAQLIDRLRNTGFGQNTTPLDINEQAMAAAMNVSEIIVAGAAQNTANYGQSQSAGATIASSWPDRYGLLFLKPRTIDVREPCFMRTIHWGEDGSAIGGMVESYRDESRRSNMIRARMDTDEHTFYSQAAIWIDLGVL